MKKKVFMTMICAMTIGLSACGSKEAAATEALPTETAAAEVTSAEAAPAEAAPTEAAATEKTIVEGMVTDAAMNTMTLLTPDGQFLFFSYPEEGVETSLQDGILLGEVISVTYTGSSDTGDAVALAIDAGSTQVDLAREDYEFAMTVLSCVKFMDQEGLADLITYPVYLEAANDVSVTVKTKKDFLAFPREEIFTDDLMSLIDYNFFNMTSDKDGFVIGDGTPNLIFNKTEAGYGITSINGVAK